MAEAVGAFYAVESVVEGVAAGALAVSGSTVPLQVRFQNIKSPSECLAIRGSTANTIKSKTYLLGGEVVDGRSEDGVRVLSLPPDFGSSKTDAGQPVEVDYSTREPSLAINQRPLEPENSHLERDSSIMRDQSHHSSWSRTKHAAVSVEDRIYFLGGISASNIASHASTPTTIIPLDTIVAYNTLQNDYMLLLADPTKCTEGIPEPRYSLSCTSSPYPAPVSVVRGEGPSLEAHGTIFLHGGYDLSGNPMNDTWTFDIGTGAWHKFPSLIEEVIPESSTPGQITYVDGRLWYVNGKVVMHLDLAEHDTQTSDAASQDPATLNSGRVGSGQWQVVYPPAEQDPAAPAQNAGPRQVAYAASSQDEPSEPTAHVIPIRTGAGRTYLISMSASNPQAIYTFQISSSPKTAASLKDTIRDKASDAISSLPDSWKSGKHEWSKVEVVQSSMTEGEVERPDESLAEFAVAGWEEYGDKIVLWGGETQTGGGVRNEGWIVGFD